MENQHRQITGYRELSQAEIDTMNMLKEKAEELGVIVEDMRNAGPHVFDQRWVSIGATDLQTGVMALVRAVAKPETF